MLHGTFWGPRPSGTRQYHSRCHTQRTIGGVPPSQPANCSLGITTTKTLRSVFSWHSSYDDVWLLVIAWPWIVMCTTVYNQIRNIKLHLQFFWLSGCVIRSHIHFTGWPFIGCGGMVQRERKFWTPLGKNATRRWHRAYPQAYHNKMCNIALILGLPGASRSVHF